MKRARLRSHSAAAAGAVALALAIVTSGCNRPHDDTGDGVQATRLRLTMELKETTDVAAIRFQLQPVACADGAPLPDAPVVIDRKLSELVLPGGIAEFENMPLDTNSAHHFADAFLVVDAGCYGVKTTPLDGAGEPSKDCAGAAIPKVEVVAGKTTEVFLINQCNGHDKGAIDVVSALNHPPQITNLQFETSKFVPQCGIQTVCATATDPDGDPLEFVWTASGGLPLAGPRVTTTDVDKSGNVTQCIQLIPQAVGKYDLQVRVYDQVHATDGGLQRVEDWLTAQGYPGQSHSELSFPVYSNNQGHAPSEEICDGIDNDCDFDVDEGLTHDADGDGFTSADSCGGSKDDCNDADANVHPGAAETCNQADDNCDGQVDEGGVCGGGPDPECAGQTCGNFTTCNAGGSCSSSGVCGSTASGGGLCVDGSTSCGGLADCTTSADCADGGICFVNSCCGRNVCVPVARFCSNGPSSARARAFTPATPVEGPTVGSR
jgi:hypothetical protein